MNRNDLYLAFNEIDDKLLARSEISVKVRKKIPWKKWTLCAACTLLLVTVGILVYLNAIPNETYIANVKRYYRNYTLARPSSDTSNEGILVWPKKYQTISRQCGVMTFNGKSYFNRNRTTDIEQTVSLSTLGEVIGTCEFDIYDFNQKQNTRQTCEIRQIKGIFTDLMVAVKLDTEYYVFIKQHKTWPNTLGKLMEMTTLSEQLKLERFTEKHGFDSTAYYILENDHAIWEILSQCQDAPLVFIDEDTLNLKNTHSIQFTATSDSLGVYKKNFLISENGYLFTNIFDVDYIFRIGEDAASQIITYASEHSSETRFEPYTNFIVGTITKISDNYIFLDDSVLCADQKDGMIFKISLDDIRILRSFNFQNLKPRDTVAIYFTGNIDTDNENEVLDAYSISKIRIQYKKFWNLK